MKILVNSKLSEHRYKTPEGYLVCVDSVLARTGKQTYRRDELFHDNDTTEIEVDRPENEVFSEQTLASFENKPLTIEHPDEDVNPRNYKTYAVGFIRDIKRGMDNGKPVMLGTLVVTDEDAINDIENGKLPELSCGYDCDIEDEDNPQQRNIRGNHVALCEHGRAGNARIVDSVKDALFEVCYIDDGDICIAIEAKDENDARQKFRRRYGMYYIKRIRKVKEGVKDMKVSHDNIREQPVFVMQSDVDKNLFFYIGKTHAMKEGEYTYAQYDMEGMTPDELRKELEANGWHKAARGPAPFIDEAPIYAVKARYEGTTLEWYVRANSEREAFDKVKHQPGHNYDSFVSAKIVNERAGMHIIDEDPYEKSTKGLEEAEKKLHDEMICSTETDCKDADESIVYKGIKIDVYKGLYGQSVIVHAPNGNFKYSSIETAKRDIDKKDKELFDSTKDAKTEYVFNYQDTYHGTRDKMRVDANNLDEAIREFGKTMALGGYGTANIYVISVSPNDGYMRAYGRLSEMLKQKWMRDSAKKLDSKKLLSIIKAVDSIKTSDRLAPSQYKALRELGYNESKWKNMTSEEASKIIAAAKQKKEGKSEKKEEAKTETSKQSTEQTSESSSSKLANEKDFLNFTDKLGLNFESAESLNGKGVLATMTRGNPRSFNRQRDKHYDKLKAAGMYALAGKYSDQFYVFESKEDMQQYATNELSNNVDSVSNELSKYLDKDAVEEIKKSMLNSTNTQYAKDNPFNLINAIGDIKIKENNGELSIDLGDKSWVGNYSHVVEQAFRNKYGYPTSKSGNKQTYRLK